MARTPARIEPSSITPAIIGRRMTEADVTALGTQLIQAYAAVEETKTEILRRLALVVIKLRSLHRTPDGDVDWAGRSWDYRQTVERMYEAAGIPPDSASGIQAALRYHVGNALRSLVPAKELEAVGLLPTSPRERVQTAREEALAIIAMARPEGLPVSRTRAMVLLTGAQKALTTLEAELDALEPEALEDVEAAVAEMDATLKAVRAHLKRAKRR